MRLHIFPEENALLAVLLQIDGRVVHLLTTEHPEALWRTGEAGHGEHHAPQQGVGHLKIPVVLDMAHGEEAKPHAALLFHHLVIGIRVIGNGRVLTTGVLLRRHCRGVAMSVLRLCGVTLHRLRLRRVGGVINCKSRLLTHQEQRSYYDSLNGFVDLL